MRPSSVLPSARIILDPHTPTAPIWQIRKPRLREKPLAQSHTPPPNLTCRRGQGRKSPGPAWGRGTLLSLLGNRLQVRGLTGGGTGCNNLKTGGDSGSSSRDLCRGEGVGVFTRICTKCPAPAWGREGGSSMKVGKGKKSASLTPTPSPPDSPVLRLSNPSCPCPRPNSWAVGENGRVSLVSLSAPALFEAY